MRIELPWPPSMNTYWRNVAGKTLISAKGREYRKTLIDMGYAQNWTHAFPLSHRLKVRINATPPDKRRRDLDNMLKPMLDALTHACLWEDDSQIDDLQIIRNPVTWPGGLMILEVTSAVQE